MFTDKDSLPKEPAEIVRPASVAAKLPSWLAGAHLMEQDWGSSLSQLVSFPKWSAKTQAAWVSAPPSRHHWMPHLHCRLETT